MMTYVATIADLKAMAPDAAAVVYVAGYHSAGDGGGGVFIWDAGSTASDNRGTVIVPDSNPAIGRWKRSFSGAPHVRWFGAVGDGTTDDSRAFQDALDSLSDRGGVVEVGGGRYLIEETVRVPHGCGLRGTLSSWRTHGIPPLPLDKTYHVNEEAESVLIIDSAATISLVGDASSIRSLALVSRAINAEPIPTGENTPKPIGTLFAGTAISSRSTQDKTINGCVVENVIVLGFAIGCDFLYSHRAAFHNVAGDNLTGIKVEYSWDVLSIRDIHFYPFFTTYLS
jgi:hypothetical protein